MIAVIVKIVVVDLILLLYKCDFVRHTQCIRALNQN
jgi:hypothetical protein